ncbi:MAG TPA: hypothetical protein VGF30_09480 [Bacteroidia bacterium]
MKKTILFFLLSGLFAFTTKATVYTVSNNTALPGSPGQYTTVSAAMSAASSGDTILIQPSATNYGNFTLTKQLAIIGSGYNPQTTSGLKSEVGIITLGTGSSGSKIIGLSFTGYIDTNSAFAISNYTISRCYIFGINLNNAGAGGDPSGALIIENNVIVGVVTLSSSSSNTIRNNFFNVGSNARIDGKYSNNTDVIKNNTFICVWSEPLGNMKNDLVENNIFYNNFPNVSTCVTSTFNNNYVFGSSTLPFGSNVGSGNISNTTPVFPVFVCGQSFTFNVDYRLAPGHVCINGGTDGTDIGMTGGAVPFYRYAAPYPMTGEPAIPQVREVTIPVSSVPAGGTLNINVKARKRD